MAEITINQAADAIRNHARLYEQLAKAADFLQDIGKLDNAKKEHEAAINQLAEEKARLTNEVAKLKGKRDEAVGKTNDDIAYLMATARSNEEMAREEAARIIANAESIAKGIIEKATGNGEATKASLNQQVLLLQEQIQSAKGALAELTGARTVAVSELDALQGKISADQSKINEMLKG